MLRLKQEKVEMRVPRSACDGAIPGRSSLRKRDLRQLSAVRLQPMELSTARCQYDL